MLAMVAATAILMVAVLLFGLQFLSVNRGHMEQRTAAESAALTAAQDLGRIAINDPNCGWVGLNALPPTGSKTKANDNWFCEVRSINEIIATARLDYIIACQLNDPFMKAMAVQDKKNALAAKDSLEKVLVASLQRGGTGTDVFGNPIHPFDDAEAVYIKNNAKQSNYVAGSLKIELGCITGGVGTSISVPNPISKAGLNPNQSIGGNYLSDIDLSYGGETFFLASTGSQVALADVGKYVAASGSQIPAVVKVEADQNFYDQGKTYVQHFVGCATTGDDTVRPANGALTISFPDGPAPELNSPQDLYQWGQMQAAKCDILTSLNGDFPVDPMASLGPSTTPAPPWSSPQPPASEVAKLGLYDWLRAAGSNVNIDSFLKMQSGKFNKPTPAQTFWSARDPLTQAPVKIGNIPTGIAHIYTIKPDGSILYRSKTIKPYPYTAVSENQLYAESVGPMGSGLQSGAPSWKYTGIMLNLPKFNGDNNGGKGDSGGKGGGKGGGGKGGGGKMTIALQSVDIASKDKFDFYIRDMVRQPGTISGGKHAGEPMDNTLVASRKGRFSPYYMANGLISDDSEIGGGSAPGNWSGGGAPPIVSRQDDFASTSAPAVGQQMYDSYINGTNANGAPRPSYVTNGMSVDIRFRRQVDIGLLSILFGGFNTGYVGEML